MSRSMRTSLLAAVLVSAVALPTAALAQQRSNPGGSNHRGHGNARSVPEFDVAAIGAMAAVIAGGGIVLARRRKR